MSKSQLISAQWLAEQMLRVARAEPNPHSVVSASIDREKSLSYVDALARHVGQEVDYGPSSQQNFYDVAAHARLVTS